MNIRQATKIMRQQRGCKSCALHKLRYWQQQWAYYRISGKRNHRIDKARTITTRHFKMWNKNYIELLYKRISKLSKRHPIPLHIHVESF